MHPFIHISIILLCLLSSFFISHAKDSKPHSSVVVALNHVRSLSTPSMGLINSTKFDFLDITEPVTTYTDGYLLSLNLVHLRRFSKCTWTQGVTSLGFPVAPTPATSAWSVAMSIASLSQLQPSLHFNLFKHQGPVRQSLLRRRPQLRQLPRSMSGGGLSHPCLHEWFVHQTLPSLLLHIWWWGTGPWLPFKGHYDTPREHIWHWCPHRVPWLLLWLCGQLLKGAHWHCRVWQGQALPAIPARISGQGLLHCFLGFQFARNPNITSPMVMGELALSAKDGFLFTPVLKSLTYPNFYYIGLRGCRHRRRCHHIRPPSLSRIDCEGNGGMIVDTGTTYTHLPGPFYGSNLSSICSTVPYDRSYELEIRTGFDLCFKVPCMHVPCNGDELPPISLHLAGGVKLTLPKESCYYAVTAPRNSVVVKCLLFQRMADDDFVTAGYDNAGGDGGANGPGAVLGSFQMQNVEVVYDLEVGRIGFQPRDCAVRA